MCLLFLLFTLFVGPGSGRECATFPDAKMDYWINSSIGYSALQRLEVREVINLQPSPFARFKGMELLTFQIQWDLAAILQSAVL